MSNCKRKALSYSAALVSLAALAGSASAQSTTAQSTWAKDHPQRAEVNHRLDNQDNRIHSDVKNGTLNAQENAISKQIPPK
jgi:hypothetical protein